MTDVEMKPTHIVWECTYCHSKQLSSAYEHHKMDYCKCGKTAIDLEVGYARWVGCPLILEQRWEPPGTDD